MSGEGLWANAEEACRDMRRALRAGDKEAARAHLEKAWRLAQHAPVSTPEQASDVYHRMSAGFRDFDDPERAIESARRFVDNERLARRPALMRNHLMYLALQAQHGAWEEALANVREARTLFATALGPQHGETQEVERTLRDYTDRARAAGRAS